MTADDFIKPGALCKTRDGTKARIYATDVDGLYSIHGAIALPDGISGWMIRQWVFSGSVQSRAQPHDHDLIGPWVEPEKPKRWEMWVRCTTTLAERTTATSLFWFQEEGQKAPDPWSYKRAPWLDPPEGWSP